LLPEHCAVYLENFLTNQLVTSFKVAIFFLQKRSLGVKKLENDWDRSRSWRERSRATWASCHKRCQRNGRWFRRSQQFATPAVWRRSRFVDISCGL